MEHTMDDKLIDKVIGLFEKGKSLSYVSALYPEHAAEIKELYSVTKQLHTLASESSVEAPKAVLRRIVDALPAHGEDEVLFSPKPAFFRVEYIKGIISEYRALGTVWKFGAPLGVAFVVVLLFAGGAIKPGTLINDPTLPTYDTQRIGGNFTGEQVPDDISIDDVPTLRMTAENRTDSNAEVKTSPDKISVAQEKKAGVEVHNSVPETTLSAPALAPSTPSATMAVTAREDGVMQTIDEIFTMMDRDLKAEEVSNVEGDSEVMIVTDVDEEIDLIEQSYNEAEI
jgi:hypothetical protein